MATTQQEIDSFAAYAKDELARGGGGLSMEELFDRWRLQHPPAEDALAIKASLRDMDLGEDGRPFHRFAEEFRERNRIPKA